MTLGFTKMHGLGNDFVVIDNMNGRISLTPEQIIFLCDRHKGIGGDAVILIEPSSSADCFMNYMNNDGTFAEMCGNGVRCVAKFLKDNYFKDRTNFKVDTRAGIKKIENKDDDTFSVNMGKPIFYSTDFPDKSLELEGLLYHFVSMGNPHAVSFVENVDKFDLLALGPKIENNSNFPNKINNHLAEKINDKEYKVRVFERACGITLASGTAGSAVYALARKYKNAEKNVLIHLPGGDLFFSENDDGEIIMRGPAEAPFSGMAEII